MDIFWLVYIFLTKKEKLQIFTFHLSDVDCYIFNVVNVVTINFTLIR